MRCNICLYNATILLSENCILFRDTVNLVLVRTEKKILFFSVYELIKIIFLKKQQQKNCTVRTNKMKF